MESHNSREELVDAEAGLASLKTPKNLSFIGIPRRSGSQTNLRNYIFILLAIVLLAFASYGTWRAINNQQLIQEILRTHNEERQDDRFLDDFKDTKIHEMDVELDRVKNKLMEMLEKSDQRNTIPTTTELSIPTTTANIQLKANDDTQDGFTLPLSSIMQIPFDPPRPIEVIKADVTQDSDESESLVPVMITNPIDDTESRSFWMINFKFGGDSEEDDEIQGSDAIESGDTEAIFPVKTNASEEGWSDYIHRMFFTPFATKFELNWERDDYSEEDSQSIESAEDVEEKTDSTETEAVTTPVLQTIDHAPGNYDYRYDDHYDESEEYDRVMGEEDSKGTDEDLEMTSEIISSTPTPTSESTSDYEKIGFGFGETTEQDAEDGSKSIVETTEESTEQNDPRPEDSLIERYFQYLATKRLAEVASLDEIYSKMQDSEEYSDHVTERNYADDSSTEAPQNFTTESSPASTSTSQEDLEDDNLSTSTEVTTEFSSEELYGSFWKAIFGRVNTTEKDAEDGSESAGDNPGVLSMQDYPSSEYDANDEYPSDTTIPDLLFSPPEASEEYGDYSDDWGYYDDGWSYISKRSIDTPSALAVPSEPISAKEFGRKISILRQAIEDENHLLQNEVSLTSGPTRQVLQSKLNDFYAKMEGVSAHIDRLHERYLRLNKLDDDYVSRELPVEEIDAPWTPIDQYEGSEE